MSAVLTDPLTNGTHDVMADLEKCLRQNDTLATKRPRHAFLANANGVIHVGAHTGQEREIYGDLPVIWIEALPEAFEVLKERIAGKLNQRALCYLVADGNHYRFGVANNAGQSSSIFDLALHKELWPDVGYVAALEMPSVTLRDIIHWHHIDLDIYDTLVLDVQGAELLVLQGAGDHLSRFSWIMTEAADFEAYKGGCQLRDLDEYLTQRGFVREQLFPGSSVRGVGTYYEALYRNDAVEREGQSGRLNDDQESLIERIMAGHITLKERDDFLLRYGNGIPKPKFLEETGHHARLVAALKKINGDMRRNAESMTATVATAAPLRLNLGAGRVKLDGFTAIDRKTGGEVYPLPYADGSVEEIVASHVLEHFSHREIRAVLTDWVRVLKPGGKIRLAVPDAEEVTRLYQAGAPVNIQGYLMGGQTDADDFHRCLFDRESLVEEMMSVGLERIGRWDTAAAGCAAGPHSLNLMGFKPAGPELKLSGVRAVMSVPRFGPLMHSRCADQAFFQLGIEARSTSSCYWAQQISILMEQAIARPDCDFVLTMDFDTIFCAADVMELYRLLKACPDVDAVIPFQSKRACDEVLFSIAGKAPGTCRTSVSEEDLACNLLPANTGHFGLTMFRADSLRNFSRPWMVPEPNAEGRWDKGQRDADIDFWKRFREAGFRACLAPKVVVGHLEEVVKWPGKDLKPVYQTGADYEANGIPPEVAR